MKKTQKKSIRRFEDLHAIKLDTEILVMISSNDGDLELIYDVNKHKGNYMANFEFQEFIDVIFSHAVHHNIPYSIQGIEYELIPNADEQEIIDANTSRFAVASYVDIEDHLDRELTFNMIRKIDYYNWFTSGNGDLADLTINCENAVFSFNDGKDGIQII